MLLAFTSSFFAAFGHVCWRNSRWKLRDWLFVIYTFRTLSIKNDISLEIVALTNLRWYGSLKIKCSIVIAFSNCPPTTIVACNRHYQKRLNIYSDEKNRRQFYALNVAWIIIPFALVLQPFQDFPVCHVLSMPTIWNQNILRCWFQEC